MTGTNDQVSKESGRVTKEAEESITSTSSIGASTESSSESSSHLVPNSPELRYREVLAIPLLRRPLFPGGIMPVTVTDSTIIKELVEVRRQGYVVLYKNNNNNFYFGTYVGREEWGTRAFVVASLLFVEILIRCESMHLTI